MREAQVQLLPLYSASARRADQWRGIFDCMVDVREAAEPVVCHFPRRMPDGERCRQQQQGHRRGQGKHDDPDVTTQTRRRTEADRACTAAFRLTTTAVRFSRSSTNAPGATTPRRNGPSSAHP